MDKARELLDFFSQYSAWVIITVIAALALAITLLVVFRPKKPQATNEATATESYANVPVLVASTSTSYKSDFDTIKKSWAGPVTPILRTTKEEFIQSLKKGYPILHLEAPISVDSVEFEDGVLSAKQFQELLSLDQVKPRLVVLAACQSFRVGKALENSNIQYSIVAVPNLPGDIAHTFYEEFYRQLADGGPNSNPVGSAYERAIVFTNVKHNIDAKEIFMLTKYNK